ncbi:SDR family NAD(P)-dependent oxidoreductase [Streptomyces sp. RK9]|uniref:SDR family NAD(P)-dependent oxidoreductase n=1 Tax=Streptomyces sp. RK9 TaxID=3239284 RepID=UPI00386F0984
MCDVRNRTAVGEMMRESHERDGLEIVVANAGVIQVAPVETIGSKEFTDAVDTMFYGTLHTSLEALPYLRGSRGRLALIGSVSGLLGAPACCPIRVPKPRSVLSPRGCTQRRPPQA